MCITRAYIKMQEPRLGSTLRAPAYAFNCRKCIMVRDDKAAFCLTRHDILPIPFTHILHVSHI